MNHNRHNGARAIAAVAITLLLTACSELTTSPVHTPALMQRIGGVADATADNEAAVLTFGDAAQGKFLVLIGNRVRASSGRQLNVSAEVATKLRALARSGTRIDALAKKLAPEWRRRGMVEMNAAVDRKVHSEKSDLHIASISLFDAPVNSSLTDYPFTCDQISIAIYEQTVDYRAAVARLDAATDSMVNCYTNGGNYTPTGDVNGGCGLLGKAFDELVVAIDLAMLENLADRYHDQRC